MEYQQYIIEAAEWVSANALNATLGAMLAVFALVFVASTIYDNYSWVDRTWSTVPVIYAGIIVGFGARDKMAAGASARSLLTTTPVLFLAAMTVWGTRLTYNFYRRGGYQRGGEDYRWVHVRTWPLIGNRVVWTLFNFSVISLFQTCLLWAISMPMLSMPMEQALPCDYVFLAAYLAFCFFEAVCDNQQWRFHSAKHHSKAVAHQYGFCVTGVFGYSRHLNVFCEASIWTTVATAAWARPGSAMPCWQWAGCLSLIALVHFSTGVITERLTKAKYPLYAVYQKTTPMLFPSFMSTTAETLYRLDKAGKRGY